MVTTIIIPAILAATVLLAGMFVMIPVDKASTVHTTIQSNSAKIVTITSTPATFDPTDNDELRVTADRPFQILGMSCVETDPDNAENLIAWTVTVRASAAADAFTGALQPTRDPGAVAGGTIVNYMFFDNDLGKHVANGGQFIVFSMGVLTNAGNGNEDIDCFVTILTTGDSTTQTATFVAV
jgi:hypothetical protein